MAFIISITPKTVIRITTKYPYCIKDSNGVKMQEKPAEINKMPRRMNKIVKSTPFKTRFYAY